MGKGDKRTRKGKITNGSFGNARPARPKKSEATVAPTAEKPAARKTAKKAEK